MRRTYTFFLLIILLGITIRIYNIGEQQLWSDEMDTLYRARNFWNFYPVYFFYQSEKYTLNDNAIYDITVQEGFANQQPLYYMLLAVWTRIFGFDIIVTRLFSTILSILSLVVIFFLAKELSGERAALIASFLFALSPFHLYYAHELRSYVLVTLLSLTSSLFFLLLLKKDKWILPYGIATGLMLLTHTHTLFLVLVQWIFFLVNEKKRLPSFIRAQMITFLVYLPWLPHFINQMRFIDPFKTVYFVFNFLDLPAVYLVFGLGQTLIVKESPWFFLLIIGGLYLLSFGLVAFYALWKGKKNVLFYVLLWLIVPVLIPWLISYGKPIYTYRYVSVAAPALILLVAQGYTCLEKKNKPLFVVLFLIATLLSMGSVIMYNTLPNRMQSKEIADYLAFYIAPGEKIYVHHGNYRFLLNYYHPELPAYGLAQRVTEILPEDHIREFIAHRASERSFWFVYASARNLEQINQEIIHSGFHATSIKKFIGFRAYHYEKNNQ